MKAKVVLREKETKGWWCGRICCFGRGRGGKGRGVGAAVGARGAGLS